MIEPVAEILDELLDHAALAQHLRAGEHEVGGGHALPQLALEAEADHLGDDHGDRLAEHGRLRLDAADAPAEHAQRVDHGGVAVGADAGVGKRLLELARRFGPHRLRQVLEVDLVADAGARRHHAEVVEGAGAPAQELVALLVALVLDLDVFLEGVGRAEEVDLHGMVDDEVDRHQRVDLGGVAAETLHGVAHGGEVDHRRHAGEILHEHAGRAIGDLARRGLVLQPGDHGADVVGLDRAPVLVPQQVLDQHLEGERQLGDAGQAVLLGVGQREVLIGLGADREGLLALEGVGVGGSRAHDRQSPCNRRAAVGSRVSGWPVEVERTPYKTILIAISRPGRGSPPMKLVADRLSSIRGGAHAVFRAVVCGRGGRGAAAAGAQRSRQDHADPHDCRPARACRGPNQPRRRRCRAESRRAMPLRWAPERPEIEPDRRRERELLVPLPRRWPRSDRDCARRLRARASARHPRRLPVGRAEAAAGAGPRAAGRAPDLAARRADRLPRPRRPGHAHAPPSTPMSPRAAWWWRRRMRRSVSPSRASCISAARLEPA